MENKNSDLSKIISVIEKSNNIVIAGHTNPDPDSIGSCLAMAMALNKKGKKVNVLLEDFSRKFDIIPGKNFIFKGDINILKPDLFISLDCGGIERLGNSVDLFKECENTIVIDHHISNNYFGKYNFINPNVSSASELVYKIIVNICDIDKDIASAIYAGILVDSGGFRHKTTSSETLKIASCLLEKDIDFSNIYNRLIKMKTYEEFSIFKKAIGKAIVLKDIPVAYTTLTFEDFKECNADNKDIGGIVEFILNMEGIEVSILAYQKSESETKISLRSKNIDVNKIASQFGGGGHINASGVTLRKNIEDSIEDILSCLRKEF